jgi:hypothetical protein
MVKFLMPIAALAVVALMMTPAVASVGNEKSLNWIGDSGVMASEILGTNTQAVVWEVRAAEGDLTSQAVVKQDQPNSDNQLTCRAIRRIGRAVWRLGACLGGC